MVLFLFVIMLLNVDDEETTFSKTTFKYSMGMFLGALVLAQLMYAVAGYSGVLPDISQEMTYVGTVEAVGNVMFTEYLFPFEITAILLTVAVVGALFIAQRKPNPQN